MNIEHATTQILLPDLNELEVQDFGGFLNAR
jgi:hypothetical protein